MIKDGDGDLQRVPLLWLDGGWNVILPTGSTIIRVETSEGTPLETINLGPVPD